LSDFQVPVVADQGFRNGIYHLWDDRPQGNRDKDDTEKHADAKDTKPGPYTLHLIISLVNKKLINQYFKSVSDQKQKRNDLNILKEHFPVHAIGDHEKYRLNGGAGGNSIMIRDRGINRRDHGTYIQTSATV
jgi:hypothetical protein